MTAELNQRAAKNPALPASPPRQAFTPFSQVHMTWNNYLQSLHRWMLDLSFRDSSVVPDVDTIIYALARRRHRAAPGFARHPARKIKPEIKE
ncbi:MAG: hypothetical protein QF541_23085 [Lentisphaeria bacterium]|jgi:hypothetical protein|nr:hypothetical protein [Lentisphaeria bacterium]